jgi:hypothetical protein
VNKHSGKRARKKTQRKAEIKCSELRNKQKRGPTFFGHRAELVCWPGRERDSRGEEHCKKRALSIFGPLGRGGADSGWVRGPIPTESRWIYPERLRSRRSDWVGDEMAVGGDWGPGLKAARETRGGGASNDALFRAGFHGFAQRWAKEPTATAFHCGRPPPLSFPSENNGSCLGFEVFSVYFHRWFALASRCPSLFLPALCVLGRVVAG